MSETPGRKGRTVRSSLRGRPAKAEAHQGQGGGSRSSDQAGLSWSAFACKQSRQGRGPDWRDPCSGGRPRATAFIAGRSRTSLAQRRPKRDFATNPFWPPRSKDACGLDVGGPRSRIDRHPLPRATTAFATGVGAAMASGARFLRFAKPRRAAGVRAHRRGMVVGDWSADHVSRQQFERRVR
jgi:hypothetical protein